MTPLAAGERTVKNFAIVRSHDAPNHISPGELSAFTSPRVARILLCLVLAFAAIQPLRLAASPLSPQPDVTAQETDPDKAPSELNHHIAGMLLIAIGLSVIGSGNSRSLAWLRWLPPGLFIAAGLFLAAWSDDEIWPRGNLGWSWLLNDAEAFQHKLYAVLLIVLGAVEAIQAGAKWRRPWLTVVFPVLCVIGAASLFFHQHSGHVAASGAPSEPASSIASPHESASTVAYALQHVHGPAGPASEHMGHAGMAGGTPPGHPHDHHLAGAAAKVQKQHAWFAVAGFLVALFKFLYDAARPPARIRQYLWASSVIFLGLLLLLYTE
jgi:hypothetical protein